MVQICFLRFFSYLARHFLCLQYNREKPWKRINSLMNTLSFGNQSYQTLFLFVFLFLLLSFLTLQHKKVIHLKKRSSLIMKTGKNVCITKKKVW